MNNFQILVVEDEPLLLEELADTLNDLGYEVVGKIMEDDLVLDAIRNLQPDLVILDINLNGEQSGVDIGKKLHAEGQYPFIYLTSYGDSKTIKEASITEPVGYLVKPFTEKSLLSCIEVGMYNYSRRLIPKGLSISNINGRILNDLTKKEFEVLQGIYEGKNNGQIARDQFISTNTVKTHIKNIYIKMDVHNRSELLARLRSIIA